MLLPVLWSAVRSALEAPTSRKPVAAGGQQVATWDPANKSAITTLSNGNLTSSVNAPDFGQGGVRSTTSRTDGIVYVEFTPTFGQDISWDETTVGITQADYDISAIGGPLGSSFDNPNNYSVGSDGWVNHQGTSDHGIPYASGETVRMLLRFADGKGWFGNAAQWDGDPVAGTNPSFTFTPGTEFYVANSCYSGDGIVPATVTVNLGASPCVRVPPAIEGVEMWDGSAPQVA